MNRLSDRLEVDIGNSRTKWRYGTDVGSMSGIEVPTVQGQPERICVSCVAGERKSVARALESAFGVRPEFAQTSSTLAGVSCGYEVPARLGVDRWLALVAAWNAAKQSTVVVDLGTAATLDFVTRDGQHTGGFIVPGLGLMATALARDTAGVRVAGELAPDLLPGRNTAQAVRRGTTAMLLGFIELSVARFSKGCEDTPVVFLTGGDASVFANKLSCERRVEPNLVLDGLRLALP